jgi:hypothetical protein
MLGIASNTGLPVVAQTGTCCVEADSSSSSSSSTTEAVIILLHACFGVGVRVAASPGSTALSTAGVQGTPALTPPAPAVLLSVAVPYLPMDVANHQVCGPVLHW